MEAEHITIPLSIIMLAYTLRFQNRMRQLTKTDIHGANISYLPSALLVE
jgi:hypothetical protein